VFQMHNILIIDVDVMIAVILQIYEYQKLRQKLCNI